MSKVPKSNQAVIAVFPGSAFTNGSQKPKYVMKTKTSCETVVDEGENYKQLHKLISELVCAGYTEIVVGVERCGLEHTRVETLLKKRSVVKIVSNAKSGIDPTKRWVLDPTGYILSTFNKRLNKNKQIKS